MVTKYDPKDYVWIIHNNELNEYYIQDIHINNNKSILYSFQISGSTVCKYEHLLFKTKEELIKSL